MEHWRTLARQPWCIEYLAKWRLVIRVAKQKGDRPGKWKLVYSTDFKEGGWATKAAAFAARSSFKQWVDTGMHPQCRLAQKSSVVPRNQAFLNSLLRTPDPARVSKRKAEPDSSQSTTTVEAELDSSVKWEQIIHYRKRSAAAQERVVKRHRRELEVRSGLQLVGGQSYMQWSEIIARCHLAAAQQAAAPSSTKRRAHIRGASHANRVSVQRRRRPDRHVQRKEQQAQQLQARVKAAKAYRAKTVQKLRGVLFNDDAESLLCHSDNSDAIISKRQRARATTQCWVVLKTYEEIGRIEDEVLNSGAPVPREGIAAAAAQNSADYFGISAETARAWRFQFETNEGKFELDGRGKWERELLVHEEDLARRFHKWMVATARAEKLSVEAALEYLNGTLLRPPHVTEATLKDYRITLPIANGTAWFWMQKCGAQCGKFAQSYYNDHHESAMVVKDRQERYIPQMDRDELRRPLWVQLSLAEYEALRAATIKADGELPGGYRYTVASGGGGRTWTQMVELHVDDSNHFESFRASHPLGGDFSVRWEGRLRLPPSAPPADLPDPGISATPTDPDAPMEAVAEAEDVAVGVAEAPVTEPSPTLMTAGSIRALKVAEARDACKALGLSENGLKPELVARLLTHRTLALEGADAEEDADGADTEEYEVKTIHAIRQTEDGATEYEVEWDGWEDDEGNPERTWEHAANLVGCEDKLAAFYLDPEHVCETCDYGHRKEVCKCHLPLWGEGQDEAIYKPFVYSSKQWKINGVSSVRKKTEGSGEMVSASTGEHRGFGFPITPEEVLSPNSLHTPYSIRRPTSPCPPPPPSLIYFPLPALCSLPRSIGCVRRARGHRSHARQGCASSPTARTRRGTGTTSCSSSRRSTSWTHSRRCTPTGSSNGRSTGARATPNTASAPSTSTRWALSTAASRRRRARAGFPRTRLKPPSTSARTRPI